MAQGMNSDAALVPEDYHALYAMLTSGDEAQRKQGQALSAKLTPDEAMTFFNVQKGMGGSDKTRVDNSVGGLPPELAAVGAAGVGRAMAGEGLSLGGRALAGAKSAVSQAAPLVKYQVVESTLSSLGVPKPLAIGLATLASGYRMKPTSPGMPRLSDAATKGIDWGIEFDPAAKGVASTPPAEPIAPEPAAVTPAAAKTRLEMWREEALARANATQAPAAQPEPPVAASSAPSAPPAGKSPQQILNEEAIAARRAALASRGGTPPDVSGSPVPSTAGAATPQSPAGLLPKPRLLSSEVPEYMRLLKSGKTSQEAMAQIQVQRALIEKMGLTTPTYKETTFPKGMRGRPEGL
jgi:hypothetical protein